MDATKYVPLAQKAIGFLSKRLSAVIGLVAVFILYGDKLNALAMICATVAVVAYIVSQTYEDHLAMKQGKPSANGAADAGESGSAKLPALLVGLLLFGAVATADILPFIDKLDLQIGPGIAVVNIKPFKVETVLLGTAMFYQRWNFEARVGGLIDDDREALVLGITRELKDLVTRTDNEEEKVLLPSVGLWCGADVVSSVNEDGKTEHKVDFLWGVNAVLAEY